jgi:hypothetical protein
MPYNIFGPHGPSVGETTERAAKTNSGMNVYTWFRDCVAGVSGSGTKITADFLNFVAANMRQAVTGMGVTVGTTSEIDDQLLLKAIQKADRAVTTVGDQGVPVYAGLSEGGAHEFRKLRGMAGVTITYEIRFTLGESTPESNVVETKGLNAPPGGATTGQRYIVAASPTGAWSGHENKIATKTADGWFFRAAVEGEGQWTKDTDLIWYWTGAAWKNCCDGEGGGSGVPADVFGSGVDHIYETSVVGVGTPGSVPEISVTVGTSKTHTQWNATGVGDGFGGSDKFPNPVLPSGTWKLVHIGGYHIHGWSAVDPENAIAFGAYSIYARRCYFRRTA